VSGSRQCDDGATADYDGCSSSCIIETGWRCSGGSSSSADTCREICGDGYNFDDGDASVTGGPCDDKNSIRYDGCYNCLVEDGWYCEDGGAYDTSDATICYETPMDGKDFGRYECDVSSTSTDFNDVNGCVGSVIQAGWECSGGSRTRADTCTEICGDGYHYSTSDADCDDGNFVDFDGCSSSC